MGTPIFEKWEHTSLFFDDIRIDAEFRPLRDGINAFGETVQCPFNVVSLMLESRVHHPEEFHGLNVKNVNARVRWWKTNEHVITVLLFGPVEKKLISPSKSKSKFK
jgi:hypothetical protein